MKTVSLTIFRLNFIRGFIMLHDFGHCSNQSGNFIITLYVKFRKITAPNQELHFLTSSGLSSIKHNTLLVIGLFHLCRVWSLFIIIIIIIIVLLYACFSTKYIDICSRVIFYYMQIYSLLFHWIILCSFPAIVNILTAQNTQI